MFLAEVRILDGDLSCNFGEQVCVLNSMDYRFIWYLLERKTTSVEFSKFKIEPESPLPWRQGRKCPWNVYASDGGRVGHAQTGQLGRILVDKANERCEQSTQS